MPPLGFPQTLLLLEKGRDWIYIIVGSAFVDKCHSLCECHEGAVAVRTPPGDGSCQWLQS